MESRLQPNPCSSETLFPLTPALSLRERENHLAVAGEVTVQ